MVSNECGPLSIRLKYLTWRHKSREYKVRLRWAKRIRVVKIGTVALLLRIPLNAAVAAYSCHSVSKNAALHNLAIKLYFSRSTWTRRSGCVRLWAEFSPRASQSIVPVPDTAQAYGRLFLLLSFGLPQSWKHSSCRAPAAQRAASKRGKNGLYSCPHSQGAKRMADFYLWPPYNLH